MYVYIYIYIYTHTYTCRTNEHNKITTKQYMPYFPASEPAALPHKPGPSALGPVRSARGNKDRENIIY